MTVHINNKLLTKIPKHLQFIPLSLDFYILCRFFYILKIFKDIKIIQNIKFDLVSKQ